ncbi:MAG: hypothetical protein NC331_16470 [Lachnospiraceae bacterium]|nr:hypothetical protein [Lachnospiraceae bacterium]MCM1240945.1 hypothetical protein [Lachnospiraceae bacterium]
MKEHIYLSLPMLEKEFDSQDMIEGFPGSLTGNFTDCLMLENAVYQSDDHTMLEQILHMYRGESGTGDGWAPGYSLMDHLSGADQPREVEYARYWHGYLVLLKPLLFLTTFNSIRLFAAALQLLLVGLVVMACARRGEDFLGKAFLLSMPFLYYFGLYASLSLSICFYVATGLLLVQLKWDGQIRSQGWYGEFFVLAGMLTSYFDLLTYPLITLGFPLCVCLYLDESGAGKGLRRLVAYSVEWGVGYLGLWAFKWILSDLLTGGNTIKDGIDTILTRTDAAADSTRAAGFFAVVRQNLSVYCNWGFFLLLAGIAVWLIFHICRRHKMIGRKSVLEGSLLLLVALFPFVWFFFTQNHSEQHWIYTFKIFSVSAFAGICGVGRICGYGS